MYNQKPLLGTLINWAHPLSKDLVGAWLFNEGSGNKVFDLSGNGNQGIFGAAAAAPTWVTGKNGYALGFDGNDYVDYGHNSSLNNTGAITIAAWINANSFAAYDGIAGKFESGNTGWYFSLSSVSPYNKTRFAFYKSGGDSAFLEADHTLSSNWNHVVATYDSDKIRLYINNQETIGSSIGDTIKAHLNIDLLVGQIGTHYFDGTIGEVGIYNRVLNTSEIGQLYVDPYCWLTQPMGAELMYIAPPVGAIMNQFQKANLGADLYDGVLIT